MTNGEEVALMTEHEETYFVIGQAYEFERWVR